MNLNDFKTMSNMQRILSLRTVAIIIQLCAVLGWYFVMPHNINIKALLIVIGGETCFHLLSILWFKSKSDSDFSVTVQAIADIIFLTLLMSFSGGATNAFVSLLLMPIVIGAVSLPTRLLMLVSLCAVAAYSALLMSLPINQHHMDMTNHFIGMWVNFLLSVIVVTLVVGTMSRMITSRERAIANQREEQLKSEQLISLGVASAQVTHQLATPLANLQLLFEELHEHYPNDEAVVAMQLPLETCCRELRHFRELATSIREKASFELAVTTLVSNLKVAINLQYPDVRLTAIYDEVTTHNKYIKSDAMLLPALCNLVQNAIHANRKNTMNEVEVTLAISTQTVAIMIRDFGLGLSIESRKIGGELVPSKDGLGMALMLSSSSVERLGGTLMLENHPQSGAVATVSLPLIRQIKDH